MSTEISFTIQGDSEGYVTFECPYCGSEFKLQAGEFQNEDEPLEELFCPYCGLTKDKNSFLSKPICEFKSIVSLDAFNDIRKRLDYVLDELGR